MAASGRPWAAVSSSVGFPDANDQIAVVTKGRGSMPSFADSLTPEQIAAVVDYTRNDLG